jgi:hypothetical protein
VPFCQRNKSSISIVPTLYKLFQNPINIPIKEEKNQIVEFVWNKETKKRKRKDTGRCWGCFFQHICINSTSFWGQFEGISGVNPSSLYSNEKSNHCKYVLFICQEKDLKHQSQQIYRILTPTSKTSLSLWGSHCATIS